MYSFIFSFIFLLGPIVFADGLDLSRWSGSKNALQRKVIPKKSLKSANMPASKNKPLQFKRAPASLLGPPSDLPADQVKSNQTARSQNHQSYQNHQSHPIHQSYKDLSFSDHLGALYRGSAQEKIQEAKEGLPAEDPRLRRLNLEILVGTQQTESQSVSAYRNYSFASLYYETKANVWLTPGIGVGLSYGTSHMADMPSPMNDQSRIAIRSEQLQGGVWYRRYFGGLVGGNSLESGLFWLQNNLVVPSGEARRPALITSGFGLGVNGRITSGRGFVLQLGGKFYPQLSHRESYLISSYRTGSSPTAGGFQINASGEFLISSSHSVLLGFTQKVERQQFTGDSGMLDPSTNQLTQSASVQATQNLMVFGFRWSR